MTKNYRSPGWTTCLALSVAGLCLAATVAQAQLTAFATGFDGTDTVNGVTTPTTYASPPNFSTTYTSNTDRNADSPTDPLATQNGWTSNDAPGSIGHGVFSTTNANQINGGTTYVGGLGAPNFGGTQAGVIGGIYAPAAQTPYAVPSAASNGVVNVSHGLTVPTGSSQLVFNVDFEVFSASTPALGKDSFSFTLANASGATVFSFNLAPTSTPSNSDNVTVTGTTTSGNANVNLNAAYHLQVTLTRGATPTYAALLTGAGTVGFNGNAGGSLTTISQLAIGWNVTNKTVTDGGVTGAGDNYLGFDNISVVVPEPSTNAMLALGLVGAAGLVCSRRQRA